MSDSPMRCAMTGIEIRNSGDGVWDDGEWISWAYINEQIAKQERLVDEDQKRIFKAKQPVVPFTPPPEVSLLIVEAITQKQDALWGRVGEQYLSETFGVRLSRTHAQGHDGHHGDDLVEIKTITPHKRRAFVQVKRTGNFNVLAVVRVTDTYELEVRFVRRDHLPPGDGGKFMIVSWSTACRLGSAHPNRKI